MRIYDEPVDVRRGLVGGQEAPEQFIWRDKLWVVTAIVSRWVETGAWWEQDGVAELLGLASPAEARWSRPRQSSLPVLSPVEGSRPPRGSDLDQRRPEHAEGLDHPDAPLGADLLAEREVWRVEAARGRLARFMGPHAGGVFDLCFDWAAGQWTLARALD